MSQATLDKSISLTEHSSARRPWVDLHQYGMYLGHLQISAATKLVLLDMNHRVNADDLAKIHFKPLHVLAPRMEGFDRGIFVLDSHNQTLMPSQLAAAIGIPNCPMATIDANEIVKVFHEKLKQKHNQNILEWINTTPSIGINAQGGMVFKAGNNRIVQGPDQAIVHATRSSIETYGHPYFLRATNDRELLECADLFIQQMLSGKNMRWNDVTAFAEIVFNQTADDAALHQLQEAIEAAAYRAFSSKFSTPSLEAYQFAQQLYTTLPTARVRTAESVHLQQYSTPLPIGTLAQRLLIGPDNIDGKTVLEPTVGHGGLLHSLPGSMRLFGVELDPKRQAHLHGSRIHSHVADATTTDFKSVFSQPEGFDYVIANPPFGGLEQPRSHLEISQVHRIDQFIALKALASRKDSGRAVFILGADSPRSEGEIKGSSKTFLNWMFDHYDIHGCIEVDGKLYSRQGSAFNIRVLVVGSKLSQPRTYESVPERLPVLSSYDELWSWSTDVMNAYAQAISMDTVDEVKPAIGDRVRFTPNDLGDIFSVGTLEGLVVDVTPISAGNQRYRILVNSKVASTTDLEQIVDSNAGQFEYLTPVLTLDRFKVVLRQSSPWEDLPDNWLIMNAPRPILGHQTMADGPFAMGRHYAAIDPTDPMAARFVTENEKLGAAIIVIATQEELVEMALDGNEYREKYYQSMNAATRFERLGEQIARLNDKTYPEILTLLAKAQLSLAHSVPNVEELMLDTSQFVQAPWMDIPTDGPDETEAMHESPIKENDDDNSNTIATPEYKDQTSVATQEQPWPTQMEQGVVVETDDFDTHRHDSNEAHLDATETAITPAPVERKANLFQAPYQPASKLGTTAAMIPINMSGATYSALNALENAHGPIDDYVSAKLRYSKTELAQYFDPGQIDALGLAIQAIDNGRGVINADQTGMGKGRFVAGLARYARLSDLTPVFLTIKAELFTDIFRDINDIGSLDLFQNPFIFNDKVRIMRYGTENDVLFPATPKAVLTQALDNNEIGPEFDMVLATYSQFQISASRNRKVSLLASIAQKNAMLLLDESHLAAGSSNTGIAISEAVANAQGVIYSSATPLKGVSNFSIYNRVFPASVDLETLPETLRAGGEALQEAVNANMANDGVFIRREHDFSKLVFQTHLPSQTNQARNIALANELAGILADLCYLSGDVEREVKAINKEYDRQWSAIPEADRHGHRMQANSMNFGSRLYNLNRQFLLAINMDEAIEASITALAAGRKPVIAVENTGESLTQQVLVKRSGCEKYYEQLESLEENLDIPLEEKARLSSQIKKDIAAAIRGAELDALPQYRELLEIMLDRIGSIKIQGRYGDVQTVEPSSEGYFEEAENLRKRIRAFPDLPLTPLDVLHHRLGVLGYSVGEVSGRTMSLHAAPGAKWQVKVHEKANAVANVAAFQNGKHDAIIITRSGSTGISLHATNRFHDSDARQREFITLQKASNIAEYLQWLGRVNRKDQVIEPIITNIDSGLPAEMRLTMMHNAKLRKLSANCTSNRESANASNNDCDLLNAVGDAVALEWLQNHPEIANRLDIKLPTDETKVDWGGQESPFVNKLMGRLMMVDVPTQESIIRALDARFLEKLEELEQLGQNPFKISVFEWGAQLVSQVELSDGVFEPTGSRFDDPVLMSKVTFEEDIKPVRSAQLLEWVATGLELYKQHPQLGADGKIQNLLQVLQRNMDDVIWKILPKDLPEKLKNESVDALVNDESLNFHHARTLRLKQHFLLENLASFHPGAQVKYHDTLKMEDRTGYIISVQFPRHHDDLFMLSKYEMKVVLYGDSAPKTMTLATLFLQGKDLCSQSIYAVAPQTKVVNEYSMKMQERWLTPYDQALGGKVQRTAYLLEGNLFKACELAMLSKMGVPVLYTDEKGNRQRAVLLKEKVSPEMVKSLPIGMDARDLSAYVKEYLNFEHPNASERMERPLIIHNTAVVTMDDGDGIALRYKPKNGHFLLSIPGTKTRAGSLMGDGAIFDIGQRTPEHSLWLRLTGTRTCMRSTVEAHQMEVLLSRLQEGRHVSKFYVVQPNPEIINTIKQRYQQRKEQDDPAMDCSHNMI